jgi:chromosome segregation ATPase
VKSLLSRVGLSAQEFLPARFALHDMMLVATTGQLSRSSPTAITEALERSAVSRVIQAFLSLFQENNDLRERLTGIQKAADDRLLVIERLVDKQQLREKEQQLKQKEQQLRQQEQQLRQQEQQLRQQEQQLGQQEQQLNGRLNMVYAERDELRERTTLRGIVRYRLKRLFSRR